MCMLSFGPSEGRLAVAFPARACVSNIPCKHVYQVLREGFFVCICVLTILCKHVYWVQGFLG